MSPAPIRGVTLSARTYTLWCCAYNMSNCEVGRLQVSVNTNRLLLEAVLERDDAGFNRYADVLRGLYPGCCIIGKVLDTGD